MKNLSIATFDTDSYVRLYPPSFLTQRGTEREKTRACLDFLKDNADKHPDAFICLTKNGQHVMVAEMKGA